MEPSTNLLIRPIPYVDESAASFLCRIACLNSYPSIDCILGKNHSYLIKQAPKSKLTMLPRFKYVLQLLNLSQDYAHLALEKAGPTYYSPIKWQNVEIPHEMIRHSEQSFCPLCLQEKAYFRKSWCISPRKNGQLTGDFHGQEFTRGFHL